MSEEDFTDDLPPTVDILREFSNKVSGWSYTNGESDNENMLNLFDVLVGQIKSDAARIKNLQLKLGQLMERGP